MSVTFDPFMYLSLPLPSNQDRMIELTMVRNDENGWQQPIRYMIRSKPVCHYSISFFFLILNEKPKREIQ